MTSKVHLPSCIDIIVAPSSLTNTAALASSRESASSDRIRAPQRLRLGSPPAPGESDTRSLSSEVCERDERFCTPPPGGQSTKRISSNESSVRGMTASPNLLKPKAGAAFPAVPARTATPSSGEFGDSVARSSLSQEEKNRHRLPTPSMAGGGHVLVPLPVRVSQNPKTQSSGSNSAMGCPRVGVGALSTCTNTNISSVPKQCKSACPDIADTTAHTNQRTTATQHPSQSNCLRNCSASGTTTTTSTTTTLRPFPLKRNTTAVNASESPAHSSPKISGGAGIDGTGANDTGTCGAGGASPLTEGRPAAVVVGAAAAADTRGAQQSCTDSRPVQGEQTSLSHRHVQLLIPEPHQSLEANLAPQLSLEPRHGSRQQQILQQRTSAAEAKEARAAIQLQQRRQVEEQRRLRQQQQCTFPQQQQQAVGVRMGSLSTGQNLPNPRSHNRAKPEQQALRDHAHPPLPTVDVVAHYNPRNNLPQLSQQQAPLDQQQQLPKYFSNAQHPTAAAAAAHMPPPVPHPHQAPIGPPHQHQQHARTSSGGSANLIPPGTAGQKPSSSLVADGAAAPPPLFERLVTEEAAEVKTLARIIEAQTRKLADLEATHRDLERRLEGESRGRVALEERMEEQETSWAARCAELERERDSWKKVVSVERLKNEKLLEQVNRKNMEIHKFIQRKYDASSSAKGNPLQQHPTSQHAHLRQSSSSSNAAGSTKNSPSSLYQAQQPRRGNVLKSPHEILSASGSGEAVRGRNVTNTLLDFFGM